MCSRQFFLAQQDHIINEKGIRQAVKIITKHAYVVASGKQVKDAQLAVNPSMEAWTSITAMADFLISKI